MLFDVLQQRQGIINRGVIESANDVARTQSGCSCGRVRFDLVDDRRFRRQDQQLANTFSAPTTRFGLVWLYLDSFNFTVAFEFDRHGLAFTSDNRPAHAVVHSEETRQDRKSTRLNSSHTVISYAVFCLKKKIRQTKR